MDPTEKDTETTEENTEHCEQDDDQEEGANENSATGGSNSSRSSVVTQETSKEDKSKENSTVDDKLKESESDNQALLLSSGYQVDVFTVRCAVSENDEARTDNLGKKKHANDKHEVLNNTGMFKNMINSEVEESQGGVEYAELSTSDKLVAEPEAQVESNEQQQQMSDMEVSDSLNGIDCSEYSDDSLASVNEEENKEVVQESLETSDVLEDDTESIETLKDLKINLETEGEKLTMSVEEMNQFAMAIRNWLALFFKFHYSICTLSLTQDSDSLTSVKLFNFDEVDNQMQVWAVRIGVVSVPVDVTYEAFRLCSFGYAANLDLEPGVVMQLAREGFFHDRDGTISCVFCGHVLGRRRLQQRGQHDLVDMFHNHRTRCNMQGNVPITDYGYDFAELLVYASVVVTPSGSPYPGRGACEVARQIHNIGIQRIATSLTRLPPELVYASVVVTPSGSPYPGRGACEVARQIHNMGIQRIAMNRLSSAGSVQPKSGVQESVGNTANEDNRRASVACQVVQSLLPQSNNQMGLQQSASSPHPAKFQSTSRGTYAVASSVHEDNLTGATGSRSDVARPQTPSGSVIQESQGSSRVKCIDVRHADIDSRIQSFQINNQFCQTPQAMATAGFNLIGADDNRVRCFSCGLEVDRWRPDDDPFLVHVRENPDCDYVQVFLSDIVIERPDVVADVVNALVDSGVGLEIMQLGFRRGDVTEAVRRLLQRGERVNFDTIMAALQSTGAHPM